MNSTTEMPIVYFGMPGDDIDVFSLDPDQPLPEGLRPFLFPEGFLDIKDVSVAFIMTNETFDKACDDAATIAEAAILLNIIEERRDLLGPIINNVFTLYAMCEDDDRRAIAVQLMREQLSKTLYSGGSAGDDNWYEEDIKCAIKRGGIVYVRTGISEEMETISDSFEGDGDSPETH